uniref:Uncharacterized protein n=2 Tax=Lepeophtheirus salmonis TaxID=72036 RepID=A0A0K2U8H8_LEPSM
MKRLIWNSLLKQPILFIPFEDMMVSTKNNPYSEVQRSRVNRRLSLLSPRIMIY